MGNKHALVTPKFFRLIMCFILVFTSVTSVSANSSDEFRKKSYFQSAIALERAKKYDEARTGFRKIAEANPDTEEGAYALYSISMSYYKEGKYAEAIESGKQLIAKYPTSSHIPHILYFTGIWYNFIGKYKEAIETSEFLLNKYPEFEGRKNVMRGIGINYGNLKQYDKEIKTYQQILNEYPKDEDNYAIELDIINSLTRQGKYEKALEKVNASLLKYQNQPKIEASFISRRASILMEMGEKDEALKELYKIVNDPQSNESAVIGALLEIGGIYDKAKQYDEALKIYQKILDKYSTSKKVPFILDRMAFAYLAEGNKEKAAELFAKILTEYKEKLSPASSLNEINVKLMLQETVGWSERKKPEKEQSELYKKYKNLLPTVEDLKKIKMRQPQPLSKP